LSEGPYRAVIEPRLYELLLDEFVVAEEGEKRVCPISKHGMWRDFQV
jgi:hypothetical protein